MSSESLLTEKLKSAIGFETKPTVIEIDKTLVRRFTEAVGDGNSLWDEVVPPSLLATSMMNGESPIAALPDLFPTRTLDGGAEIEFYRPIHMGDTITITGRLADVVERQGRLGPMLVVSSEVIWRNQRQEVVAKSVNSTIKY